MVSQPKITVQQIHARATDKSFQRGQKYCSDGAIFDTVKRGNDIEGFCEGSQAEPYHVRATLNASSVGDTSCTCEYDYGGDCKHIVALLLTYIETPEIFEEHAPVQDTLASRDKDELIALIQMMIERYPDLQILVDRPTPGKHSRKTPLDTSSFRKELRYAIRSYDGWGDHSVRNSIHSIVKTAQQFSAKDDWQSASAIYRALLDECLQKPDDLMLEDDGETLGMAFDVLENLGECLDHLADDVQERQTILACMVSAYITNVELGGLGLADDVPDFILHHAKRVDLPAMRQQIETAKTRKKGEGNYGRWGLQAYESLLAQLDTLDNTDPKATLKRLRDEGMYSLLVTKLIEMERLDEAVAVVEKDITAPHERLHEFPRLTAAGRDDDAVRLAQQMLKQKYDDRVADWLLERLRTRNDREGYFQLQLRRIKSTPHIHVNYYAALKEASQTLGNWDDVRWDLIAWLEKQRRYDVLTQIYIHDEEWEHAWASLSRTEKYVSGYSYSGQALELQVASKSRHVLPAKALPVYIKHARYQIDQRDRDHYRQAAEYLRVIRELYKQLNDTASWEKLIEEIRTEFKKLPAFQEELRKAWL